MFLGFVYAWILEVSILNEVGRLRGKVCKRIIKSASLNDFWGMKRYAAINGYLSEVTQNKELKK